MDILQGTEKHLAAAMKAHGLKYLSEAVHVSGNELFSLDEGEDWNAATEADAERRRMIGRDCDKVLANHLDMIDAVYFDRTDTPEFRRDKQLWTLLSSCLHLLSQKSAPTPEERQRFRAMTSDYARIVDDLGTNSLYDHLLWRHVPDTLE